MTASWVLTAACVLSMPNEITEPCGERNIVRLLSVSSSFCCSFSVPSSFSSLSFEGSASTFSGCARTPMCFDPRLGGGDSEIITGSSSSTTGVDGCECDASDAEYFVLNVGDTGEMGDSGAYICKKLGSFWFCTIFSAIGVAGGVAPNPGEPKLENVCVEKGWVVMTVIVSGRLLPAGFDGASASSGGEGRGDEGITGALSMRKRCLNDLAGPGADSGVGGRGPLGGGCC